MRRWDKNVGGKKYWLEVAQELSLTSSNPKPVGVVVVRDNKMISTATNSHKNKCKRAGYPTGVGYDLCKECQYENHAERRAIKDTDVAEADLYLAGHTYCCEPCKTAMNEAGIKNVYIK